VRVHHEIPKAPDGHEMIEVELTRATAIKAFCSECLGWETHPRDCTSTHCPLYPFRGRTLLAYGHEKREVTPEQRAGLAKARRMRKKQSEITQDASEPVGACSRSSGLRDAGRGPFHGC
jgi:hypothetical protein